MKKQKEGQREKITCSARVRVDLPPIATNRQPQKTTHKNDAVSFRDHLCTYSCRERYFSLFLVDYFVYNVKIYKVIATCTVSVDLGKVKKKTIIIFT